jgi:RNA polymerase sigma factor (sigma-70 family)
MPATLVQVVRRCLNTLTVPSTDADLIRAFQKDRNPEAFAEIVARHGPVVLGVARRVLGRSADVDDVFQATFLTLARNIQSVRDPYRLAGWLHCVALRTARRALNRRKPTLPMETASGVGTAPEPRDLSWREGLQILDAELNALPGRLRSPLVLCYLDGLTRDEAARRLGYSLAKLKRRLEEGRGRLRARLVRRGVSAALLVAAADGGLRAQVPTALATRAAALPYGPVPAVVEQLTVSVATRSLTSVLWNTAIVIGLAGAALVGGYRVPAGAQTPPKAEPAQARAEPTKSLEAPLPPGAIARLGTTLFRHNNGSNSSVLSKDGKLLATTGKTTIAVWDTATGQRKHLIRNCGIADGFTTSSQRIALSPDGSLLANFAEHDVRVCVWDLTTGKQAYTIGWNPPDPGGANGVARGPRSGEGVENLLTFDEAGKELLLIGGKGVRRFDAKTGKPLGQDAWTISPVATSPNGRWCLANEKNNTTGPRRLAAVDLNTRKPGPFVEIGDGAAPGNCALAADGKRFAVIEGDVKVTAYDVATGKAIASFEHVTTGERDRGYTVPAFSEDGKWLHVGTTGGNIHRYDLEAKKESPVLGRHLWYVTGVHAMPDGRTLISAGWDGVVRKFDLGTGKEIPPPPGYVRNLAQAVSPDGTRFALADWAGKLDMYDAAGKHLRALDVGGAAIGKLAFSPDGKTLAAAERDGTVRTWDTTTWRAGGGVPSAAPGKEAWVHVFQFSPDGRRLLMSLRESSLLCLDTTTWKEVWAVAAKDASAAGYSPDGQILVTGGWDNNLTWRDPATGQPGRVVATNDTVDCIEFAPDGRTLVSGHHNCSIRRWDAETGKPLGEWSGHRGVVWWARFSPDGKWLASGSTDETVRVWDVAAGKELMKFEGHDAWVWAGDWVGGRRVVSTNAAEALLWDVLPPGPEFAKPDALWEDLAGDAVKAFDAQRKFLADPKAAATFFRLKQGPEKAVVDEKQVRQWIADLDRDEFRTRERATKGLRALGKAVLPYLREGRAKARAEGDQRIAGLIEELDQGPTPDDIRRSRAVQVLELAGTPEAVAVLKEWAGGLPGTMLTTDAAGALKRLSSRP